MKYVVTLGAGGGGDEHRVEVEFDGDGVRVDGEPVDAHIEEVDGTPFVLLAIGTERYRVTAQRNGGRGRYALSVDGRRFDAEALDERTRTIRDMSRAAAGPAGPAPLVAPMPGMVVRVNVAPGDLVAAGQGLVVMEAMKMENELRAAGPGRVRAVHTEPGVAVEKGTVLVEIEDAGSETR
jgi:pyruvate carboxylase subunit B